jgi:hypothetical protein
LYKSLYGGIGIIGGRKRFNYLAGAMAYPIAPDPMELIKS